MVKHVKLGPNYNKKYGLSNRANKGIDQERKIFSNRQSSSSSKRERLGREVEYEGGDVRWNSDPKEEKILPYTVREYEGLKKRISDTTKKLLKFKEEYGMGIPIHSEYDLQDMITGKSDEKISYASTGELEVTKGKPKIYPLSEANAVLRNLERYINAKEKVLARNQNQKSSSLEKTLTAVIAGVGLIGGILVSATNITGNVISSDTKLKGALGLILIVLGFIALLFYKKAK